ncbi:MAG: N-acetyltransferase [Spirochaetales bacterium]|nr:N-acetyltransferase [Spirochaetales bacterium]MCF7937758.1 N-acetyltransferase [Spirochaetales bacterium]
MNEFFVHESSYVDDGVSIGKGSKVWHFSHILTGSVIGKQCVIGQNVMIGPSVTIGNGCKVQNNVSIYKGVVLEDDVFCGPSMVFTNVINPRAYVERKNEFLDTRVKQGATIGANATVVCGNTIGQYSMIAAGAVVTSDVPDYAIMMGVPARWSGWVCECGVRLEEREAGNWICPECGKTYTEKEGVLYI